jgi:hypothetical protein
MKGERIAKSICIALFLPPAIYMCLIFLYGMCGFLNAVFGLGKF